jgi:hypothetical protein
MLADLDEALRRLLVREVPLDPADVDVEFERPDRDSVARFNRPTVDLFLFDIGENVEKRQSGWQPGRNGGDRVRMQWPPMSVNVRYLVTVWASEVEDQHQLLFHLYRSIQRLSSIPEDMLEGSLAGQASAPVITVESFDRQALLDLWGVLDNAMRPSLVLKATLDVDLNLAREAPLVRTSTLRFKPSGAGSEVRHRIGGKVLDDEGRPLAGATVIIDGHRADTGPDGRFQAGHLTRTDAPYEVLGGDRNGRFAVPGNYDLRLGAASDEPPPREGRGRRRGGGE